MSSRGLLTAALVGCGLVGSAPGASGPFVYPQKGQSQAQTDQDHAACDRWARQQTGIDPNALPPSGRRGGKIVGGAAKGAAAGAAVGAIAGDAGTGAGAGAVVGGLAGRRRAKQDEQAAASEQQSAYTRAFSACMEGRGYTVR
jgi:hypothetical protein